MKIVAYRILLDVNAALFLWPFQEQTLEQYGRAINRQFTFLMSWLLYLKFVWL